MSGFWQSGFWAAGFWSSAFWAGDEEPAVPPAPTSGGGSLRRKRRTLGWGRPALFPVPLTEPAPIEDEEALHLLGMI